MKGNGIVEIRCPMEGCGHYCHANGWHEESHHHAYYYTRRTMARKALKNHLDSMHPSLSSRERSLICDAALLTQGFGV
jgi:hypothetical protein